LADAQKERAEEAEKAQRLEEERAKEAEKRAKEQRESAKKLRLRAWIAAGLALVAVIFAVAVALVWQKSESNRAAAKEQARIAESRRLAAESSSALSKYPQRSLLLAVEAVRAGQSAGGMSVGAAEQSLREALRLVGGQGVLHFKGGIATLAISPDNRWLVAAGQDRIERFDLVAKKPAANPVLLGGPKIGAGSIVIAAISPDNRWLAAARYDEKPQLWDLTAKDPGANPVLLTGFEGNILHNAYDIRALAISPDSRWLVMAGLDGKTRLWDLAAKDPAASPVVLTTSVDSTPTVLAITSDDHWLVTGG
jgi:hypothetical protein